MIAGAALGVALVALVVALIARSEPAPRHLDLPEGMPRIRVALAVEAAEVAIEVRGPFTIHPGPQAGALAHAGARIYEGEALAATLVRAEGDEVALGSRRLGVAVVRLEAPVPGSLRVRERAYRGELWLHAIKGRLTAVNHVPLEAYVVGVLGAEMPLGFPEEALRAQAIAARTYGLFHHLRRQNRGSFDVRDDTSSQVYKGLLVESEKAQRVVVSTWGVILTWAGKPLQSYFHSTCGGETISARWVFGEADIPPFSGATCGYCKDSRYYEWESTLDKAAMGERLARYGVTPPVARVEPSQLGPAGHVGEVRVEHQSGETRLSGSAFRLAVGPSTVRSTRFTLADHGSQLLVKGRGWGHAVGLCQIGARGMAREGHSGESILTHYYPKIELARLYDAGS